MENNGNAELAVQMLRCRNREVADDCRRDAGIIYIIAAPLNAQSPVKHSTLRPIVRPRIICSKFISSISPCIFLSSTHLDEKISIEKVQLTIKSADEHSLNSKPRPIKFPDIRDRCRCSTRRTTVAVLLVLQ